MITKSIGVPENPEPFMLAKNGCVKCKEVGKAVRLFNNVAPIGKEIQVVYASDLDYRKYGKFVKHHLELETVPLPFIWYDGVIMKWDGYPDKTQTLARLRRIGGV